MTHAEALNHISGLRGGLSKNEWQAWGRRLEEYHPEHIVAAANKVADEWMQSSAWPIGAILAKLPKLRQDDCPTFNGFCWDPFTGRARGSRRAFDSLPAEERRAIAIHAAAWDEPLADELYPRWREAEAA